MRRREFITLVGGAAVAWPIAARAQQSGKLPVVGFLGSASASAWSQWVAAFAQRLHQLNWVDGRTIVIEYRWAEGRSDRYAEIAAEFVRLKVDAIVTSGASALAAKQATSAIPIVFMLSGDPVTAGLVVSLSRPGGNVTGLSNQSRDLVGKRLEFLREVVPNFRRFAILVNIGNPNVAPEMDEIATAARALGLAVEPLGIRRAEDISPAIEAFKGRTDALYVVQDPLLNTNGVRISTSALNARLPTMNAAKEFVQAGGLMSYGTNFPAQFRRAAEVLDKILRGTKPADIPIEQPIKFDFVINLITARALALAIPPVLLARADEVIE